MAGVTGDKPVSINTKAVVMTTVPLIPVADLTVPTSMVNTNAQSGKQIGAVVFGQESDGTGKLYVAQGSKSTDAWVPMGGTATVVNATTSTRGIVLQSAATADQAAVTVSGADVAALVTSTNTALATLVAKINAILAAERTAGQKAS